MAFEKGERWGEIFPSRNIVCKDCKHRLRGNMPLSNIPCYTGGKCDKYTHKPNAILFEGALCPRYEKE